MWFKVDDGLPFHRKVIAAGNAAMGLWVRAGAWCAQHLTDGFVPDHVISVLGTPAQRAKLIKAGLWVEVDEGCQFHEWNEKGRQPKAKVVREERERNAARQAKFRRGALPNPQVKPPSNGVTSASVTTVVTPVVTPPPTRPVPYIEELPLAPLDERDQQRSPSGPPPGDPPDDRFDEFYDAYPRRQDRRAAQKAWRAAMKRGADPDHVIDRARAYARLQIGNERRFIKLPATWLNAGSYDDEMLPPHLRVVPLDADPALTGQRRCDF